MCLTLINYMPDLGWFMQMTWPEYQIGKGIFLPKAWEPTCVG
jgi:hypothetical protein